MIHRTFKLKGVHISFIWSRPRVQTPVSDTHKEALPVPIWQCRQRGNSCPLDAIPSEPTGHTQPEAEGKGPVQRLGRSPWWGAGLEGPAEKIQHKPDVPKVMGCEGLDSSWNSASELILM